MTTAREIAADQFGHRRAWLAREVAERKRTQADAERRLLPWLHIAAMAGVGSCSEAIASKDVIDAVYQDHLQIFPYDRAGQTVQVPLVLSLSQDQRTAALGELARARDAAFDAVDRALNDEDRARRIQQARSIALLAHDLDAPPYPVTAARGESTERDAA